MPNLGTDQVFRISVETFMPHGNLQRFFTTKLGMWPFHAVNKVSKQASIWLCSEGVGLRLGKTVQGALLLCTVVCSTACLSRRKGLASYAKSL